MGFFAGGWLAGRPSGNQTKYGGRLHGLVTWALGSIAILYFVVNSTARLAGIFAGALGNVLIGVAPGAVQAMTANAATGALITGICGLVGALVGGNAGGYRDITQVSETRRVA